MRSGEDEGPSVEDVRSPGVSFGDGDLEVDGTTCARFHRIGRVIG